MIPSLGQGPCKAGGDGAARAKKEKKTHRDRSISMGLHAAQAKLSCLHKHSSTRTEVMQRHVAAST